MQFLQIKEAKDSSVNSPELVAKLMAEDSKIDREAFWVLHLNAQHYLIEKELVALGVLDGAPIHPREVFKKAILNSAHAIITVHNHPSSSITPSGNDKEIWERLKKAGEILGIEVLDNLIITPNGKFYSAKQEAENGKR